MALAKGSKGLDIYYSPAHVRKGVTHYENRKFSVERYTEFHKT